MILAPQEDCNAEEELQAGRDRRQAAAGSGVDLARPERGRGDRRDRRQRGNVLPLASGVWRAEERPGQTLEGPRNREYPAATSGFGSDAGQADPAGGGPRKLLSPARRRACIEHVRGALSVSERRASAPLGQHRASDQPEALPYGVV